MEAKNFRFSYQTILQNYYVDYQGREVGWSKLVERWKKDGGNFLLSEKCRGKKEKKC